MSSSKSFLTLMKPVGLVYLLWQYRLPFLTKVKEISRLAYCVLVKGNRILVVYTKNHPRMNAVAQNPPQGILFVRLTSKFNGKNYFIKFLASKIDIIYEDGPTTFSLTTDQPIVKEYEHHHFGEHRLADKQIKKIFVMSKWAKPNFDDPEHKMEVLYPAPLKGISARKAKIETKQLTILLVGSGAACKGADILYQAFENLERKFENQYQLNLVMASNYKRNYHFYSVNEECLERTRHAYEKSLKKRNVYFGRIYPPMLVDYFYRNSDIYVFPTRYDSCPFSVLEAMSGVLPVIATNITSIGELVKHGENGFLLDVKDFDVQSREYFEYAVKEVEKYMTILIEDASLRLEMGNESLQRVKRKFNLDYKKERLKKLFEEIVPRN
jgi:glycosyltransferase involved in cell wall biosynthesis